MPRPVTFFHHKTSSFSCSNSISLLKIEFTLSPSTLQILTMCSRMGQQTFLSDSSHRSRFDLFFSCIIKPIGLSRVFLLSLGPPAAVLWLVRSDKLDCRRVRMKMARKFARETFPWWMKWKSACWLAAVVRRALWTVVLGEMSLCLSQKHDRVSLSGE